MKYLKYGIVFLIIIIVITLMYYPFEKDDIATANIGCGPEKEKTFFDNLRPASVDTCTPSIGYINCIENTYTYGDAVAYAKLQTSDIYGERSGYGKIDGGYHDYYVKYAKINVAFVGDKLYATRGATTWGTCTSSGCTGTRISQGAYTIANAPASQPKIVYFTAFDYNWAYRSGYWAYAYVMWGWVGSPTTFDFYVVDCYDDSDVPEGYYCDKSGTWDTWTAKEDPCVNMPTPENICDGYNLWSQKCVMGEYIKDQLIEANSVACGCLPSTPYFDCVGYDLYEMIQDPVCTDNYVAGTLIESNSSTCGCVPSIPFEECVGYDLYEFIQSAPCVNDYIAGDLIEEKSEKCGYVCTEGETLTYTCTDGSLIPTSVCTNNKWKDTEGNPIKSCPLNWTNLKSILIAYYDDLINWIW